MVTVTGCPDADVQTLVGNVQQKLSCLVFILAVLIVSYFLFAKSKPKKPSEEISGISEQKKETDPKTITICALRDHSFETALEILKESDFEERTGIPAEREE